MRPYWKVLTPICVLLLWSVTRCSSDDAPPPEDTRRETCPTGNVFCFDTDADRDGFAPDDADGSCQPLTTSGCIAEDGDCDDADRRIRPGATEVQDGVDNDCDGEIDEAALAPTERTDIYWGDTHVHTRFSFDAYVTMSRSELDEEDGDPIRGELVFARDVREACDFAHFCSQIDFMASTEHAENVPESLWGDIQEQLRSCNSVYSATVTPAAGLRPLTVFAGFEWTQGNPDATGTLPARELSSQTQYGHKNVIFPDLEEETLPLRVVSSSNLSPPTDQLCSVVRLCGIPAGTDPDFECTGFTTPADTASSAAALLTLTNLCAEGVPEDDPRFQRGGECFGVCAFFPDSSCQTCDFSAGCDLDASDAQTMTSSTCAQFAYTADGLFTLLRSWTDRFGYGLPIVGAHGTTWFNGGHGNWDADYEGQGGDPGNFRQHDPALQTFIEVMSKHGSGELYPSDPDEDENCFNVVTGEGVECFQPTSSSDDEDAVQYVKEGSTQYALAQQAPGVNGDFALNLGLLGSMDTHHARPGSSAEIPAFGEWESSSVFCDLAGIENCPLQFAYTGALAAVHALATPPAGLRGTIFQNLRNRNVYGTSGPRIELWFYMTNPPASATCIEGDPGECPMGSLLPNIPADFIPRFRVHAKGAQQASTECAGQPAPPNWEGGPTAFYQDICRGQCFHVTSELDADRTQILYLEVVRVLRGWLGTDGTSDYTEFTVDTTLDDGVFGEGEAGEAIRTVDTIRLRCTGAGPMGAQNCWADFEDPQWSTIVARGGNAVYYVRAIQEETTAYNGPTGTANEQACDNPDAEEGRPRSCFGPTNERAWSSPIFLFSGRVANRLPPR